MTDIPTIAKGLSEARDIPDELVERVRSIIASCLDDDYTAAFKNKSAWINARGMVSNGLFRDSNEPFKSDYDEAAQAAIRAVLDWQASGAVAKV